MISIWGIIVAGVYPDEHEVGYFIGICIFVISILLSLLILPFLIYFLEKYCRLSKEIPLGPGGKRNRERQYEFDTCRIIIAFLITDMVVLLLVITLSSHGIYFLSTMYKYRDYLYQFDALSNTSSTKFNVYVIPFSHYALYGMQALYQATQEGLLLWGFLFLANYICKLTNKPFHFKTFTFILLIRISLTLGFNFNLWDVIMNEVQNKGLHMVGLAAYPLPTFEKSYKSIWLLYSLIVFVPFAVYLRRLALQRLRALSIAERDNFGEDQEEVLIPANANTIAIAEIRLVVRYSWLYIAFLVVFLAKTIFECNFPSFALRYIEVSDAEIVNILTIAISAIDIFLSGLLALMLLGFITLFGYSAARDIAVRRNESEHTSRKNVAYYCKKLLTIGGIIFLFSLCCTGMIGYLHFVANDYFQITLMPGDFIELNNGNTSYSSFSETCDTLKYSRTPPYVLTPFDKMKLIYPYKNISDDSYYCPNSQDLGFYEHSQQLPEYREQIHIFSSTRFPVMWFPAGTTLSNFTHYPLNQNSVEDWSLNFSVIPYPYPCYKDYIRNDPNRGLGVICSNYDHLKENPFNLTCDTQNRTDSCSLKQDSIIFNQTNKTDFQYSFTVSRPNHTGNGTNLFNETVNNSKDLKEILFISLQYHLNMDIGDFDKNRCSFFVVCHNDMWKASLILVGIFVFILCYLCLSVFILSKLLSPFFV